MTNKIILALEAEQMTKEIKDMGYTGPLEFPAQSAPKP